MASPSSLPPIAIITYQLLLILTRCLSQDPSISSFPAPPTMANCGPTLLPLAVCAPFVQGSAQFPAFPCCENLKQLYVQQPGCLCLLLDNTTVTPFPINSTLAMQLPGLCALQVDISTCSGSPGLNIPPNSQVPTGPNISSPAAASPLVEVPPRQDIMGFGFARSSSAELKNADRTTVSLAAAIAYLLI